MNDDLSMLQGREDSSDFIKHFPEIFNANRGMLHRPSGPGAAVGHALLMDLQDRLNGSEDSIFNDPHMLQDYLN